MHTVSLPSQIPGSTPASQVSRTPPLLTKEKPSQNRPNKPQEQAHILT